MARRSFEQLNFKKRLRIEAMLKHNYSKKEMAEELGVHISTIYRELKRGTYEHLNSDYTTETRYSPEIAEARYQEGLAAKGAPLKIGNNYAVAEFIEGLIIEEHYSPAAVCAELRGGRGVKFGITFCRATIYKYIDDGNIFPKGTDFGKVRPAEVAAAERWLNNYPREILGFKTAASVFAEAVLNAA